MSTSITSNRPWGVAGPEQASGPAAGVTGRTQSPTGTHPFRKMGLVEDGVLLMLVVFLFPLIILLVGAPIALCVRAIVEIVHRLF